MWAKISNILDYWLLKAIRILNVVIFAAIILFLSKTVFGFEVQQVLTGISILWGIAKGFDVDFISFLARKIVTFSWGASLILLGAFGWILFNHRFQLCENVEELLQKNGGKS